MNDSKKIILMTGLHDSFLGLTESDVVRQEGKRNQLS